MCSYMDGAGVCKMSQRKTTLIQYHLHVESKMRHKWIYICNRNRITDIENRLVIAKGRGLDEGWSGRLGLAEISSYIEKWINNNNILLYSTENYIQYLMINHNGKEHKNNVYICITELLYCTAVMNTLLINYSSIKKRKIYFTALPI